MCKILRPLKSAGVTGIELMTSDGIVHWCHPLLAIFVGDYPEQCLATCSKHRPRCPIAKDELGENYCFPAMDLGPILEALCTLHDGPVAYAKACEAAGIKPVVNPFWANLPYVRIFR